MTLLAAAARIPLDPPLGIPMMGYGARDGMAEGRHDALYARALYVGDESGGAREALLVELDVCLIAPAQAARVKAEIAARTGVSAGRILVGCIHTHSGPEMGLGAQLAGAEAPAWVGPILGAAVEAGVRAHADAAPARLGTGRTEARIGRNRRRADGPVDPGVVVVRIDSRGGSPLAVLYLHGCHPTVLGHENRIYSADWPGAAGRAVEEAFPGALALFAPASHADIDPRTRGLMDLAIEGQSVGVGFDEMEALGREVGEAVAEAAQDIKTSGTAPVGAASARVVLPVRGAADGEEAQRRHLAASRSAALEALGLAADSDIGTGALFGLAEENTRALPEEARREARAVVRAYLRDRTAARFAGGLAPAVEVQALRLGDASLLGVPLEPTTAVGMAWRERLGSPLACVVGIANGWLRYLPHAVDFGDPGAHLAYEVLMSTFAEDAADQLLERGAVVLGMLDRGGA